MQPVVLSSRIFPRCALPVDFCGGLGRSWRMGMRAWLLGVLLLALVPNVRAEPLPDLGIAAVVNDEVISTLDLENRLKLVLLATHLSDTPEVRERLRPQILRALIDQRLQMQRAAAEGVQVSEAEIDDAVHSIEAQQSMAPGELLAKLDASGVPRQTFLDQVRAQLSWTKLVLKTIRPNIHVSEEELDRERSKPRDAGGTEEVQIALLSLPVESPERDDQVKALAQKLADEIHQGAPFESVARELKGSETADAEPKPFWVTREQMEPSLKAALEHAKPGEVTEPVRTPEGYTLAKMLGHRTRGANTQQITEVVVKDILMKLKSDAGKKDVNLLLDIGRQLAAHPGTCTDAGVAGIKDTDDFNITVDFRRETLESMSDALRDAIGKLQVGEVSEPYATREGLRMFMLCERTEKPAALADREETMQRLYREKLDLEAQKYLRKLRRDATVDIRI
ncbi:MAG: peptidylprolyl isomerase [Alphaproteobacteria bacterium]|nr:peptidylprolyl isomerase [Alphaproteobacteria bacterium]